MDSGTSKALEDMRAAVRLHPLPILSAILVIAGLGEVASTYIHYKFLGFDLIWSMNPWDIFGWFFRLVLFVGAALSIYFLLYVRNEQEIWSISSDISKYEEDIVRLNAQLEQFVMEGVHEQEKRSVREAIESQIESANKRLKYLKNKNEKREKARVKIEADSSSISIFSETVRQTRFLVFITFFVWFAVVTFIRLYPIGVDGYCDDQDHEPSSWAGKAMIQIPYFIRPQCKTILIDLSAPGEIDHSPQSRGGIYQVGRFSGYLFFIEAATGGSLVFPESRIVATSTNRFPIIEPVASEMLGAIHKKIEDILQFDAVVMEKLIGLEHNLVITPAIESGRIVKDMAVAFGIRPEIFECTRQQEPLAAIYFPEGSTVFDEEQNNGEMRKILDEFGKDAGRFSKVVVVGFASPTGSPLRNYQLSQDRAQRVVKWIRQSFQDSPAAVEFFPEVVPVGRGEMWRYGSLEKKSYADQRVAQVYLCISEDIEVKSHIAER